MKRTKQWNWLWFGLLATMLLTLTACGGGGGGGKDDPQTPDPKPAMIVTQDSLLFTATAEGAENPTPQTFSIGNSGDNESKLEWSASVDAAWLTLSPASGSILKEASATLATTVTASVNISGLAAGDHKATITVTGQGLETKTIGVTLTITDAAGTNALTSNKQTLTFIAELKKSPADDTLVISNAGKATLDWTATIDATWLTISPANGILVGGPGNGVTLTAKVSSQNLTTKTNSAKITIKASGVDDLVIPVSLTLTDPPPTVAKSGSIFVGGSAGVTQLSSLIGSKAAHKSAATTNSDVLPDAKVTITRISKDGSKVVQTTSTDARGAYQLKIDGAVAGETLTIVIEKKGYTSINKTIILTDSDFPAGETRQLTVSGKAGAVSNLVVKADLSGAFKASGEATRGFSFGLMRQSNGTHKAFASRSALRKAADASDGSRPELQISIPQSWASGADALTAKLAAFDPSIASERQMFPGEFKGVGGSSVGLAAKAAGDQPTYQLESVSFFQADVTPNNAAALTPPRATGARKAATEPTIINKYIPQSGCEAIKKYSDRDATAAGIQVPLYTYNPNTGVWGYLGEGTLQTWNGNYVDVPAPADGSLAGLSCGTTDYYFKIVATDWYTWWNLDYPLLFAEPETVTVTGTVRDQQGQVIPGVYIEADGYAKGANSYHYTYTQNDGTFTFDILMGNGTTVNNFEFSATNYSDWSATPVVFTPPAPINGVSAAGDIKIIDRLSCTIIGTLSQKTETGSTAFAGAWIWVQNNDYTFYNWAETDTDGKFTVRSTCNEPIDVWAWGNSYRVNVDGNKLGQEKSDANNQVVLNDIIQENQAPYVWTGYEPYAAKTDQIVYLYGDAWDLEGDYPFTKIEWTITDQNGSNAGSASAYDYNWTPPTAGTYTARLTVADSRGKESYSESIISVTDAGNTPPMITWWMAGLWDAPLACGQTPNLYAAAYDPDGDQLTFSWQLLNNGSWGTNLTGEWRAFDWANWVYPPTATVPAATSYAGLTNGYSDDLAFTSSTPISGDARVAISDGKTTVYEYLTVPEAGGLEIYSETWPLLPILGDTVYLYSSAYDNNGEASYSWTITAPGGGTITPSEYWPGYVYFTPATGGTYKVTLTVTGQCSTETRQWDVAVNAPSMTTIDVTVQ